MLVFLLLAIPFRADEQGAETPTIEYPVILLQGNTLKAVFMPQETIPEMIKRKYPEMADLLLCIARKESSFDPLAIGDNGLAKGIYQIHTDKHEINDECAFDPECALDFTALMIKSGKGYLWTTYQLCIM